MKYYMKIGNFAHIGALYLLTLVLIAVAIKASPLKQNSKKYRRLYLFGLIWGFASFAAGTFVLLLTFQAIKLP